MNAALAAWGTLLRANLMSWEEYVEKLHALFLEKPDSEILLMLEMTTSNEKDTLAMLLNLANNLTRADKSAYVRNVLSLLENLYRSDMPLAEFNAIARRVYEAVPAEFACEEPFTFLTTADDYLDIDLYNAHAYEDNARGLFEQTFAYCNPDCPPFERPAKSERDHFFRRLFKRRKP